MLADDAKVMDSAWLMLITMVSVADKVPLENRQAVLDCGFAYWVQSETLTLPGVPCSSTVTLGFQSSAHRSPTKATCSSSPWRCGGISTSPDSTLCPSSLRRHSSSSTSCSRRNTDMTDSGAGIASPRAHAGSVGALGAGRAEVVVGVSADERGAKLEIPPKYATMKSKVRAVRKQAGASR